MKMEKMIAAILLATLTCAGVSAAQTLDVRLRIWQNGNDETVLSRENLLKVKQFILQGGQRETYCNMYNDNPAYHTTNFRFYLNPDSGQQNINCDPAKSDFNNLTIRSAAGGKNQYRTIEFIDAHAIYVTADRPTDDLTVGQLRKFIEDALKEFLAQMDKGKPNKELEATR